MKNCILLRLALITYVVISLNALVILGQTEQSKRNPPSPREIAKKILPSVVLIVATGDQGESSLGSGFFVKQNMVATNYHVIEGMNQVRVKTIGGKFLYDITEIVDYDETNDLALLKVENLKRPALRFAKVSAVAIGDTVFVAGNPEGLEGTFSNGIVSGIRKNRLIQITAPISHGSSGGPVLNQRGEVIGIATAMSEEGQNLNFAVPVSYLATLLSNPGSRQDTSQGIDSLFKEHQRKKAIEITRQVSLYIAQGSYEKATALFSQALEFSQSLDSDPASAEAFFQLGQNFSSARLNQEAIRSFKVATTLEPNNATYSYVLGVNYVTESHEEEAVAECRRLKKLDTNLYNSLLKLMCGYFKSWKVQMWCP